MEIDFIDKNSTDSPNTNRSGTRFTTADLGGGQTVRQLAWTLFVDSPVSRVLNDPHVRWTIKQDGKLILFFVCQGGGKMGLRVGRTDLSYIHFTRFEIPPLVANGEYLFTAELRDGTESLASRDHYFVVNESNLTTTSFEEIVTKRLNGFEGRLNSLSAGTDASAKKGS